jgi:succinate dehydrogenase/fumarate reductase-like Fe-S protein
MLATGMGDLTCECRASACTAFGWERVFTGPDAMLYDMERKLVGK